ncbi:MAG: AMP-binding protein [Clostridia bacterium]|nr:AMP-binding protein [Clostridia bacterium]
MQLNNLDLKIHEMAARIRELREVEGISVEEMAEKTGVSVEEYLACERGESDLNFAFLYRCASAFRIDVTNLIEGKTPKLYSYFVTRRGEAPRISDAHGMTYYNMAYGFKNRISEPLYVVSKYSEEAQSKPIELTTHTGQEIDIVIDGQLEVQVGSHTEILNAGDSIYFDSGKPHGERAAGGRDCSFYAIVLNPSGEPIPELQPTRRVGAPQMKHIRDTKDRIYKRYIDTVEDENGTPVSVTFKNEEHFNYAFDIIDEIADKDPDKIAMVYVSKDKIPTRFTWKEIKQHTNRCVNYFLSLGIKRGDRVMLVLKRNYQFWFATLALEKIGAVSIPATFQLLPHDYEYRFKFAGVSTIICTADGEEICPGVEEALKNYDGMVNKLIVNGTREGWRDFNEEYMRFSTHYAKPADAPGGDDYMLMYFTSGTSGFPKLAVHSYKYPLGQFHTAKYWHDVDPDGLHLSYSDTGWAKAAWGKLYGQWMCETALFVYDEVRFHAEDILPMFKEYNITTFCAPPTLLRMLVRQDITKYDLSSIQHMTTAGEALNPEVYRLFEQATGLQILEGFGQSETALICGNMRGAEHKIGSMGKPAPIYDVQILGPDDKPVPAGETGEICINIKNGLPYGLAVCYYKDEEKTAETWRNGWYHTGDTAYKDEDGFFFYVGRVDDVIKSSGYRIGPFEIESVIMELPYVLECGVSAAPDEVRGQIVKASIVLTKGTEGTEELKKEIQDYVKAHTAPYKYPRLVVFRDSLPKSISGKIQRSKL